MLRDAAPVTFVLTADMAKARDFYTDVLGLTETGSDPYAISYDLAGTLLRLTQVDGHHPGPHTVLGWSVADIEATVDALAAKDVACAIYEGFGQDARGIWSDPERGVKIAWFHDREGNNLSVMQVSR